MDKSKKLVFFGNERLATSVQTTAPVLRALIGTGYEVVALVASTKPAVSRSYRPLEISEIAKAHNIPLLTPDNPTECLAQVKQLGASAAILVAYGKIVPAPLIEAFPKGIINLHPSLLPKYRGPTPIETAMVDGTSHSGISLMSLSPKMDAGPIFAQQSVVLNGDETKQALAERLLQAGADLLLNNLAAILESRLSATPQDDSQATYTKLLRKSDGDIDWQEPAETIERKVRAYLGYPKSRTTLFGKPIIITSARVAKDKSDGELVMACGSGWLEISQLVAPSGRSMTGADFIRGYKT
jgi:methionyl-tRNA formyltransferase